MAERFRLSSKAVANRFPIAAHTDFDKHPDHELRARSGVLANSHA